MRQVIRLKLDFMPVFCDLSIWIGHDACVLLSALLPLANSFIARTSVVHKYVQPVCFLEQRRSAFLHTRKACQIQLQYIYVAFGSARREYIALDFFALRYSPYGQEQVGASRVQCSCQFNALGTMQKNQSCDVATPLDAPHTDAGRRPSHQNILAPQFIDHAFVLHNL